MPRKSRIASHRIAHWKHHIDIDAPIAAVSDAEESDIDMIDEVPAKKAKTAPAAAEEEDEEDDESVDEDEFQVEKILDHKTHKAGILYRIKWLGYDDPTDETWEPEENLYVHNATSWSCVLANLNVVPAPLNSSEHITSKSAAHLNQPENPLRRKLPPQQ